MEVKGNISIELNSDPSSQEYLKITEAAEKMINTTYKTSTFNTTYMPTKLIGMSPANSAIRFWMYLRCSVRLQAEEITAVFQKEERTIKLSNSQELKVQLSTMIIWCEGSMPRCSSGYYINKYNGFCDGIKDCWDGEDEANCVSRLTTPATDQQSVDGMMVCADGNCVNKHSGFCDGVRDCSDGSDEQNCDCESSRDTDCSSVVTLTGRRDRKPCQGSVISSRWVLTTESCADDRYICAGSPNLTKYKIESRYSLDSRDEGIALLLLDTPVTCTDFRPIPLPELMNQTEAVQTSCKVTGLQDTKRQGEWYVIASDSQWIVIHEAFRNLRGCQIRGTSCFPSPFSLRPIGFQSKTEMLEELSQSSSICGKRNQLMAQVQTVSPLVCLKANDTWVLTAIGGGCSKLKDDYRRINNVLSKIKENLEASPVSDDN